MYYHHSLAWRLQKKLSTFILKNFRRRAKKCSSTAGPFSQKSKKDDRNFHYWNSSKLDIMMTIREKMHTKKRSQNQTSKNQLKRSARRPGMTCTSNYTKTLMGFSSETPSSAVYQYSGLKHWCLLGDYIWDHRPFLRNTAFGIYISEAVHENLFLEIMNFYMLLSCSTYKRFQRY